jgi:hypothetical protein
MTFYDKQNKRDVKSLQINKCVKGVMLTRKGRRNDTVEFLKKIKHRLTSGTLSCQPRGRMHLKLCIYNLTSIKIHLPQEF